MKKLITTIRLTNCFLGVYFCSCIYQTSCNQFKLSYHGYVLIKEKRLTGISSLYHKIYNLTGQKINDRSMLILSYTCQPNWLISYLKNLNEVTCTSYGLRFKCIIIQIDYLLHNGLDIHFLIKSFINTNNL